MLMFLITIFFVGLSPVVYKYDANIQKISEFASFFKNYLFSKISSVSLLAEHPKIDALSFSSSTNCSGVNSSTK
jgi:hypothetical protein